MSEMGHTFAGSMPEFYDRFLVPFMFAPFACDMAARLSGLVSGHLLELAAGTGAMTHALAATLPSGVRITATDLNPAMLVQAQTHAGSQRIAWQEADAQALPFAEQMFDAVLCQFGVMFFPDKQAAFREALRVLRRGGRLLFNVWGQREGTVQHEASLAVGQALGRDPSTLLAPPYNDVEAVRADLTAAGFSAATAVPVEQHSFSALAHEAAVASCHGGLLRAAIERDAPNRLAAITDQAAAAIAARFGDGPIEVPLYAIVFTAQRPAE
jgi:SAM-dependent methyltransferase